QMFLARGNDLVQDMLRDNWVLGGDDELSSQDRSRLMLEMEQLYFEDYAHHWGELLGRIALDPLPDAQQAAQNMSILAAANSPLVKLLKQVRNTTVLTDDTASPKRARRSMERRFEPLQQQLDQEVRPGPDLLEAIQVLDAIHLQFSGLAQSS